MRRPVAIGIVVTVNSSIGRVPGTGRAAVPFDLRGVGRAQGRVEQPLVEGELHRVERPG